MKEIDVTKVMALRFWWSYTWRHVLFYTLACLFIWVILFCLGNFIEISEKTSDILIDIFGWIASISISILVIKKLLKQPYDNFKISVLDKETNEEVKEVSYGMAIHFYWSYLWKTFFVMLGVLVLFIIALAILAAGIIAITGIVQNISSIANIILIILAVLAIIMIGIASIFVEIFVLKSLLKAEYSDYRITVTGIEQEQKVY